MSRCLCWVQFAEPEVRGGVAGHPPVTARGECDAAYLGSVGHGGAFVLLGEETFQEEAKPVADGGGVVFAGKGVLGEEENFARAAALAHEVVEKEVVQVVGADDALGFLGGGAVGCGREEFGADGGGANIVENDLRFPAVSGVRGPGDEVAHEGLGHADVDVIH